MVDRSSTDTVYADQAIYDAICAAVTSFGPGEFNVNTKKFIETFNNHRDRALCTSLNGVAQTPRDEIKEYGFDPSPYYNGLDKQVRADDLDAFAWRLLNAYSKAMGISGTAQAQREIDRLRTALELLTDELPEDAHSGRA